MAKSLLWLKNGVGSIAGMGFTMSLCIGALAFPGPELAVPCASASSPDRPLRAALGWHWCAPPPERLRRRAPDHPAGSQMQSGRAAKETLGARSEHFPSHPVNRQACDVRRARRKQLTKKGE